MADGSLEWGRAADLIEEGYHGAEAMRDRLLPLAVSEPEFEAWPGHSHQRVAWSREIFAAAEITLASRSKALPDISQPPPPD